MQPHRKMCIPLGCITFSPCPSLLLSPFCAVVERQNSFDSLDYYSHDEEEEARTAPPTNKKGKKKKHFSMFRRSIKRKSKSKKKNDEQFSVSAGLMQTLSVPPQGVRQSFSNASLSYESEASIEHTESDQELVDTLMNPTPSPSPLGTELLQATEQQVGLALKDCPNSLTKRRIEDLCICSLPCFPCSSSSSPPFPFPNPYFLSLLLLPFLFRSPSSSPSFPLPITFVLLLPLHSWLNPQLMKVPLSVCT